MSRYKILLLSVISVMLFSQCRSVKQAKNLTDCNYAFVSITNFKVGETAMGGKQSFRDFNAQETSQISQLLMARKMPITLTANISIHNPNNKTAALDALDWIFEVKDKEVAKGAIKERIEVQAGQSVMVPISVNTDIGNVLKAFTIKEITELMFSITDKKGIPIEGKLKIKPSVKIGKKYIKAPNYFSVKVGK